MASTLVAEDNGFVRLTEDGEAAAVDAGGAGSTRDIAHRIGGAHGHTAGALQQLERDGLLECAGSASAPARAPSRASGPLTCGSRSSLLHDPERGA